MRPAAGRAPSAAGQLEAQHAAEAVPGDDQRAAELRDDCGRQRLEELVRRLRARLAVPAVSTPSQQEPSRAPPRPDQIGRIR